MRNFCQTQFVWATFAASFREGNKENPCKLVERWPRFHLKASFFQECLLTFYIMYYCCARILGCWKDSADHSVYDHHHHHHHPFSSSNATDESLGENGTPQKNSNFGTWHDPACNMEKLIRKHNKQHEIFPPPQKKTGIGLPACFSQATSGLAEQATRSYYPRSVVQGW